MRNKTGKHNKLVKIIKKYRINWKRVTKVLLWLNMLDLFSTLWFLNLGYAEGNKFMWAIMQSNFPLALFIKIVIGGFLIMFGGYLTIIKFPEKQKKHILFQKFHKIEWLGLCYFYGIIVNMNFFIILNHYTRWFA